MSKAFGLAGLRIGFMIADAKINELIHRIRNPFNINELAQVAAIAAFQDLDFVQKAVEMTWNGLDYFYAELKKMNISYTESQGNFVLIDTEKEVTDTYESLLKLGVILRPLKNYGLPNHLRISVGLPQENEFAMAKLKLVLKK
jgi:histidinol-phosphate aminotransferase